MSTYLAEHASAYADVAAASGNRVLVFTRVQVYANVEVPEPVPSGGGGFGAEYFGVPYYGDSFYGTVGADVPAVIPPPPPDILIAGVGIAKRGDPQRYRDLRLSLAQAMTLLFVPSVGTLRALTDDFVRPNDSTTINGVLLTVRDVGPLIALDGLIVAGTLVLSA